MVVEKTPVWGVIRAEIHLEVPAGTKSDVCSV